MSFGALWRTSSKFVADCGPDFLWDQEVAMMSVVEISGALHILDGRTPKPLTMRRAFRMGVDACRAQESDNPFAYDEPREAPFAEAWEDGFNNEQERMGDEYADYCDPSMRDCYE